VDTTYRRRERHYGRIGQLIGDLASIRPGHYIAFFTSFEFLENVAPFITAPGFEIMRQERHVPAAARARLLDRLERPAPPVLLCAVQGGIFAEGIDLPGERLVGAFVVGPGLPLVSVERELIRRHFDERGGAGFEFAYLYPGMNRAIQAAGRVIRTPDDVGLIVLLDRRFTFPNYARCLPPDWYDESPGELVSRDPARDVREFWSSLEED
jgi:DNA excision repair protein ERCC-2